MGNSLIIDTGLTPPAINLNNVEMLITMPYFDKM